MTKFSAFLGMALMMLLFVSCGDDAIFKGDSAKGKISLLLDINTSITASRAESSSTDSPTVHDLTIKITPQDGSHAPYVYGYDDFVKADANYPIGEYLLEVYCGDAEAEGFNAAHYYGSTTFTVKPDKTTQVAITASMSKSMFTIMYTDALKGYLRSYSATLQSEGGASQSYLSSETRPLYLKSGVVSIYVNIEKQSGAASQIKVGDVNAEKAHHYKITIDLNADEEVSAGEGALTIVFDEMLQKEDVTVDLRDNLVNAAPPTVSVKGYDGTAALDYVVSDKLATESCVFNLTALGGFKEVNMTTVNPKAIDANWPASVNLMGLTDSQKSSFEAMGLKVDGLWKEVTGEIATVDVTGVVEKMSIPAGGSDEVKFSISVVDQLNKTNGDPVSLTVSLKPVEISLTPTKSTLVIGEGRGEFDLQYNGSAAENLKFVVDNKEKTPATLTKTGEGTWHCAIDVPFVGNSVVAVHNDVTVSSTAYKAASYTYTREDADYTSSWQEIGNPGDVWATKLTLTPPAGIGSPVFLFGSDGKSFAKYLSSNQDGKYLISNLTASTQYYMLVCDEADHGKAGICYRFTTEAATQLYNGNMESWYKSWSKGNAARWVPGVSGETTIWGTFNDLTTSPESYIIYCTVSGTIPTSDASSGSYAALIRTVAWGKDQTAAGIGSVIYNVSQGELYLGKWNSQNNAPDYGISFSSRPSSLSFKAKYTPKNSNDQGYAEITVKDANGNTIATNNVAISSSGQYNNFELPLNYTISAKAAQLIVKFISTNAGDTYLNRDNLNLSSGLNRVEHVGSQLYIDDITLNY